MIKLEFEADGLTILCAIEKSFTKNYCPSLSTLNTQAKWGKSSRSGELSKERNSGITPCKPDLCLILSLLNYFTSPASFPADVPNSALLFFTIIDDHPFILQSQYRLSSALVSCSLCAFLSAEEVIRGLVFFYGNYFCAIFKKFPLLTKFCIKTIATKIEKIILSSTFSSHLLLGAGGQAIHDGPAFLGVITISPCRQATSHCSATVQILS